MTPDERRARVVDLAMAGIRAADAPRLLDAALRAFSAEDGSWARSSNRPFVIAAGKSAVPMFETFTRWYERPIGGAVLTAPGNFTTQLADVRAFVGGHPHPTDASVDAGRAALQLAQSLRDDDLLVVLLSGGASALMAAPAPPLTLADKIAVTRLLLSGGVAIDGLNTVRKHLSLVKGGQLAAATTAAVQTFALSDITQPFDDDPATIGSGPTVPDPTTFGDACRVLDGVDKSWPERLPQVAARLHAGLHGHVAETPKAADRRLSRSRMTIIGNRQSAAAGVITAAKAMGLNTTSRDAAVTGEARQAAIAFLAEALTMSAGAPAEICHVATGETTVTVRGQGVGGRNQEFVLAAAMALDRRGLTATIASVGTDGVDGPTPAAGALCDETTCRRALAMGLDPAAALAGNDSYTFFAALGDAIVTGPTGTNVCDFMIALIP